MRRSSPDTLNVRLNLIVLSIAGTWTMSKEEKSAAWDMHVELATRVGVQFLQPNEGMVREAVASLHGMFAITREILHRYGPAAGRPREGELSFGRIAVAVLNASLRPFLSKWHPLLVDHEALRKDSTSPAAHERSWDRYPEMLDELTELHTVLRNYADLLAEAAGVPSLLDFPTIDGEAIPRALATPPASPPPTPAPRPQRP